MKKKLKNKPKPLKINVNILLDSGAFSAWNIGTKINIHEYIEYVKDNLDCLSCYVSLDVIPGEYGAKRTQREVDTSAAASYDNHQIMKAEGLEPIPVFHQGEQISWLERYLSDGEKYIGVSAFKDITFKEERNWLDWVFSVMVDQKGLPLVKVHGFAITAFEHMIRYPWKSVDSTTWSLSPGFGTVMLPAFINGAPNYNVNPTRIIVSGVQQKSPASHKRQFGYLGPYQSEVVEKYLEEEVGVTLTEVRYSSDARRLVSLFWFMKFCEHRGVVKFKQKKNRFSIKDKQFNTTLDPGEEFLIYHATSPNNKLFSEIMGKLNMMTRLLSFYEITQVMDFDLPAYAETGFPVRSMTNEDGKKLYGYWSYRWPKRVCDHEWIPIAENKWSCKKCDTIRRRGINRQEKYYFGYTYPRGLLKRPYCKHEWKRMGKDKWRCKKCRTKKRFNEWSSTEKTWHHSSYLLDRRLSLVRKIHERKDDDDGTD